MSHALRTRAMTRDEFLEWADRQEHPYEFDGFAPVAMTRPPIGHNRIALNVAGAFGRLLGGTGCQAFALEAGVATIGDAVRYPDVVVTCTRTPSAERIVPEPVVVFEIVSPSSSRLDRILKVQEYAAVPSIRRYAILELTSIAATLLYRASGDAVWSLGTLTGEDALHLPELGIELPMAELYEGVDIDDAELG